MLALFISSVAYFLQVTNAELSFQNIMKCYRTQPQAVSHVSPLLTSCKFTSACLFTNLFSNFLFKVYRSVLLRGRRRPPLGSSGSDGGARGEIIFST